MNPARRNRAVSFALALAATAPALGRGQGQRIQFRELPPEVIQERLGTVGKKNADRQQALMRLFEGAGCQGERLTEQHLTGKTPPNVICTSPGATPSVILVAGHFDHVPRSYGVIDNWSGASLLPSLYQSLADRPRKHTFVFVGFTEEEKGLVGSVFYVKHLSAEETARIRAMVNLDSLALGPTKVWASRADHKLMRDLAAVAQSLRLPLQGMNVDRVGTDDTIPFAAKNVPVISIHSLNQETWRILHTPGDSMASVKLPDYYQSYRLVAAYLAYLDATPDYRAALTIPLKAMNS